MAKISLNKKTKLKSFLITVLSAITALCLVFAAACAKPDDKNDDETSSKEDTQLFKNGNFEFYNEPAKDDDGNYKGEYFIATPDSWTSASASTASYVKSGVIGTSPNEWAAITASDLADRLDANEDLEEDDEDYEEKHRDYNGMRSRDILYKNSFAALKENASDADKVQIDNPLTHKIKGSDGNYTVKGENGYDKLYQDDKGNLFTDEKHTTPYESHVLMLHNYLNSNRYGTAQYYTSVSVTLEKNTAAEISVWVKTANLTYSTGSLNADDKNLPVEQSRGAYIEVSHTVGGNSPEAMTYISNINTEKLNPKPESGEWTDNGWVKYTVVVNACDFADSTVTVMLGLGEANADVEGYAFFDDLKITKYASLKEAPAMADGNDYFPVDSEGNYLKNDQTDASGKLGTTCSLLDNADKKRFRTDVEYQNNQEISKHFFNNRYFLLDLASTGERTPVELKNVSAGLTVDNDKYISSSANPTNVSGVTLKDIPALKYYPDGVDIDTSDDILAIVNANADGVSGINTPYKAELDKALSTASKLPDAADNASVLLLFSARGAAYTASSSEFIIAHNTYLIISLWVKTSDMSGKTAATLKLIDSDDKDNTASITVDSTNVKTDIDDDHKDIYNGWVLCSFFVKNETEEDKTVTLDFSFGNTTISGTNDSSYVNGWAAMTNVKSLAADEDEFNFTGSGSYTASLNFTEENSKTNGIFDEAYGGEYGDITANITNPTHYHGVNGGNVFGDHDTKASAGLVNKNAFINSIYGNKDNEGYEWVNSLLSNFSGVSAMSDAEEIWNAVFGASTVQPLLIVNTIDTFTVGENEIKAANYGYISDKSTFSASSYSSASTRVKVGKGAVAYLGLVDPSSTKNVLGFKTQKHTYWYDAEGNVLKSEPKLNDKDYNAEENVLYTLQSNGLYLDDNGNYRANVYAYAKDYKFSYGDYDAERAVFYNANGDAVSYDDLVSGETYYTTPEHTMEANHYLKTSDGVNVYYFSNGVYKYVVDGKPETVVLPFETKDADGNSYLRYFNDNMDDYKYIVKVDARYNANGELNGAGELGYDENGNYIADKWITVTFAIHTGNKAIDYRLELWSGDRNTSGVDTDGNTDETASKVNSYVMFDKSGITYTESNFNDNLSLYENRIIEAYKAILIEKDYEFETNDLNVAQLEKIIAEEKIDLSGYYSAYPILAQYNAKYHTFSLYDSANYLPFNEEAAKDGETGYEYDPSTMEESVAYLSVKEEDRYTVFADYTTVDKEITRGTADDSDDGDEDEENNTDGTTIWLLISSIILVVALLFTMISILIRNLVKEKRKSKKTSKNNYNSNKRNRYVKKIDVEKSGEEDKNDSAENGEQTEQAEQTAVEESENTASETETSGEASAETEQVEETENVSENSEETESNDNGEDKN